NRRWIVSGSDDKTLRLWDLASGSCLHTLEGHTQSVMSVEFSPDGSQILSGSYDHSLRLWEATTGRCLPSLGGSLAQRKTSPLGTSNSIHRHYGQFSRDGELILSKSDDGTLQLWHTRSDECFLVPHGEGPHGGAELSPDATLVLIAKGWNILVFHLDWELHE